MQLKDNSIYRVIKVANGLLITKMTQARKQVYNMDRSSYYMLLILFCAR